MRDNALTAQLSGSPLREMVKMHDDLVSAVSSGSTLHATSSQAQRWHGAWCQGSGFHFKRAAFAEPNIEGSSGNCRTRRRT